MANRDVNPYARQQPESADVEICACPRHSIQVAVVADAATGSVGTQVHAQPKPIQGDFVNGVGIPG
jgi:hypothetical protein